MRISRFVLGLGALLLLGACAWLWTPDKPLSELEPQYLRSAEDYRDVAGLRLHVRASERESAPAIILLHGLGASLHTWEPWARMLDAEYRVIRYDLPGYGLTGADPTGRYTTERSLEVLLGVYQAFGIERATLIGNSLGGRIAWMFAARHPGRVDKLILIAPDGFASGGFEYETAPEVPAVAHVMRYALPRFLLRMNLEPAYADPEALREETVSRYHDLIRAPGVREAMIRQMEQVRLVPPEPLLAKITVPTLLLWGEDDAMIPASHAQDYLRAMPNARLVVLPDLGHVPHEEAPAQAIGPVRTFLAE